MEGHHRFNVYFFFFILIVVGVMAFFIFQPFLTAIIVAAILAVLFRPTYEFFRLRLGWPEAVSSLLTCLVVMVIIVTPVISSLSLTIAEANKLFSIVSEERSLQSLTEEIATNLNDIPILGKIFGEQAFNTTRLLSDLRRLGENAIGFLETAYQSITYFVFWIFVMFFTLYYFLSGGAKAMRYAMKISPLRDEHEKILVDKFISMSRATLKGTLVVAVVQGALGGIAFWVVGIPAPAIWGLLMAILSVIPLVGPPVIWLPAALVLLALGQVWQGVFLLAFGTGVISVVDNILRPKLVGKDTSIHPLLIFFATLGGISLFGLSGFIIGPIVVSLFIALGEIYSMEFKDQLKEYNG